MKIDWTKPLETVTGKPVTLLTDAEMDGVFGGTNPDHDGDYWVKDVDGTEWCVGADGEGDTDLDTHVRNAA